MLNRGSVSTCIRYQGESIVDLMWATASVVRRVGNWRVVQDVETLGNHLNILMEVCTMRAEGDALIYECLREIRLGGTVVSRAE